jgi:hypothetical protein
MSSLHPLRFVFASALSLSLLGHAIGEEATTSLPSILFVDMLDAADCLGQDPEDPIDVGKWSAIVTLEKNVSVPDCASCYGHIDGSNIIGVLPIIKDTLREPFLIHSPEFLTGSRYKYRNHGPEWFWTPSKTSEYDPTIDPANPVTGLAALYSDAQFAQVTSDDLLALVSATDSSFTLPTPFSVSELTSNGFPSTTITHNLSASPLTTALTDGTKTFPGSKLNSSNYLVVPDTIQPLPDPSAIPSSASKVQFSDYYAVPYPKPSFIAPSGGLLYSYYDDPTILDAATRNKNLSFILGTLRDGTIQSRQDPLLHPTMQSPSGQNFTPVRFPAYQYYDTATINHADNLELCGLTYEVIEYGSVYQEILSELDAVLTAYEPTATAHDWLSLTGNPSVSSSSYFNGVTGFWTGRDL